MGIVSGGGGGGGWTKPSQWTVGATGALDIKPTADVVPLTLEAFANANNDLLDAVDRTGNFVVLWGPRGDLTINPHDPAQTGLTVNYATGAQTNPVADFEGISGAVRVFAKGHLVLTNHAAPADGDLAAGDCALWFDQTNAAAKFMLKGKTADGTVVAASVVMA